MLRSDGRAVMFFLGTHRPNWLALTDVPLFVSTRGLRERKTLPVARGPWALDSGGFTELSLYGHWRTDEDAYVRDVERYRAEIGGLQWVAPQDWMCEPFILDKTGGSVEVHQQLTVSSFLSLRDRLGPLVIPVLQGWTPESYLWCCEMYEEAGVDLEAEPVVGVGSVCRRQDTAEAGRILRRLASYGLRLHGFGVKVTGLESFSDCLASADSMAWSVDARWHANHGRPSCDPVRRRSCANCLHYALEWRDQLHARLGQQRLWEDTVCVA